MPDRLSYDEAMLFSSVRLKIQDPELKQGKVEKMTTRTNMGKIERPWGAQGGFAIVYKFRTRSGMLRALRCFSVAPKPDMQSRYEHIGPYFYQHAPNITTTFKYHDNGILVKEQNNPAGKIYPIIEMDWIEGVTLVERIDELCQNHDRAVLRDLSNQWVNILRVMQNANIAHGDLAGLNIMVKPDGHMVLIDYDGVYIPGFEKLPQLIAGQADYQHPRMWERKFNKHMDAFSGLVIYTVLLALSIRPELWNKYIKADQPLDGNMLFTQQDFEAPQSSALFKDLEQSNDQQLRKFVQQLKRACQQSINSLTFPYHLVDPDYEKKLALTQLETALKSGKDERIVQAWQPFLEQYAPAQPHRMKVEQARKRVSALSTFRTALHRQDIEQIVSSYDAILDQSGDVTEDESKILGLARSFLEAYRGNDDNLLINVSSTIQQSRIPLSLAPYEAHIQQARNRAKNRKDFRDAIKSRQIEPIANGYILIKHYGVNLTGQERTLGELAYNFIEAYKDNNDHLIRTTYEAIQNFSHRTSFIFLPEHKQRAELAQQRIYALARFQVALLGCKPATIVQAYDAILDEGQLLKQEEKDLLKQARAFVIAYQNNDDFALPSLYDVMRQSGQGKSFMFTEAEKQRVELARRRKMALVAFKSALVSCNPRRIATAYSPILDNSNLVADDLIILTFAQDFKQAYDSKDTMRLTKIYEEIERSTYKNAFKYTLEEKQYLNMIKNGIEQRDIFDTVAEEEEKDPQKIVDAYNNLPEYFCTRQRDQLAEQASKAMVMREKILSALKNWDSTLFHQIYDQLENQQLLGQFSLLFTESELTRIQFLHARETMNYHEALMLVEQMTADDLKGLNFWLQHALKMEIAETKLPNVTLDIHDYRMFVGWDWPELITRVVIFCDTQPLSAATKHMLTQPLKEPELSMVVSETGTYTIVDRKEQQAQGWAKIASDSSMPIYTTICVAMYNTWADDDTWRLSPVIEKKMVPPYNAAPSWRYS